METQRVTDTVFFNNVTGNYSRFSDHPEGSLSLLDITILTICGIGSLLNSLVIIVILYGSLIRSSVYMTLLLVLAVTDTLHC